MTSILVTGAAGDIGTAIAEVLAQRGHRLALADHPTVAERLDELCRRLGAECATFDVTDEAAVTAAVERLGSLRGLVNNAGYQGVFAPLDRYPLDDARRVIEVNLLGAMTVLAVATRAMTGGAVVNIASMAGVSGAPNMPTYAASKAGVIGLTKAAAKDLAPHGIRAERRLACLRRPGRSGTRRSSVKLRPAASTTPPIPRPSQRR